MSHREIRAGNAAGIPGPAELLERARRLYVLAPLIDTEAPPVSFWVDHTTWSMHYMVDIQQGETAVLSVCPIGTVVSGISTEASTWNRDTMLVENSLPRGDELLELLHAQRGEWEGISYCLWRRASDDQWQVAPGMLVDEDARADNLGQLHWLALPVEELLQELYEYAEPPPARRKTYRKFLAGPWEEIIASARRLSPELRAMVTDCIGTVAMREWMAAVEPKV